MKVSDYIFGLFQLVYCKCHKVNFNRGGWYNDLPDFIKKKKATVSAKSEDDKSL